MSYKKKNKLLSSSCFHRILNTTYQDTIDTNDLREVLREVIPRGYTAKISFTQELENGEPFPFQLSCYRCTDKVGNILFDIKLKSDPNCRRQSISNSYTSNNEHGAFSRLVAMTGASAVIIRVCIPPAEMDHNSLFSSLIHSYFFLEGTFYRNAADKTRAFCEMPPNGPEPNVLYV